MYGEAERHTEAVAAAERALDVMKALPSGSPYEQQKQYYERLADAKEKVPPFLSRARNPPARLMFAAPCLQGAPLEHGGSLRRACRTGGASSKLR